MTYRQLMVIITTALFCSMSIDAFAARIPTKLIEKTFKGAEKASRAHNWYPAYGTARVGYLYQRNNSLNDDSLENNRYENSRIRNRKLIYEEFLNEESFYRHRNAYAIDSVFEESFKKYEEFLKNNNQRQRVDSLRIIEYYNVNFSIDSPQNSQ